MSLNHASSITYDITDQLPTEMLLEIFSFLHSKFIFQIVSHICKRWKAISHSFHQFNFEFKDVIISPAIVNSALFEINKQGLNVRKLTFNVTSKLMLQIVDNLPNTLQYLQCYPAEEDALLFIINQFANLKSLDIRKSALADRNVYYQLMNSKLTLPNLTALKADYFFNEEIAGEFSIKPQLISLALLDYSWESNRTIYSIASLEYPNLKELQLCNLSIDCSIIPIGLKSISFKYCTVNFVEFEKASQSLEQLEIVAVKTHNKIDCLQKSNLKKLTIMHQDSTFWGNLEQVYSNESRALNLTSLKFEANSSNIIQTIKKICNVDKLTELDISNSFKVTDDLFLELLDGCELKNLQVLKASDFGFITRNIIPILHNMKSLKYLDLSSCTMLEDSDRETICGMNISYINCSRHPSGKLKETNYEFFDSLSNISICSEPKKNIAEKLGTTSSFDIANRKFNIFIKDIQGVSNIDIEFKSKSLFSFAVECSTLSNENKVEFYTTKRIPFGNILEWNEEFIFDSLISEISCDYTITISLIRYEVNPLTGLNKRSELLTCNFTVFNSNFELYQGDLIINLDSSILLGIQLQQFDSSIKYDLERHVERPLLETFDMKTGIELDNSSLLVPFLRKISFQNPWVMYESSKLVSQWEKPEIHEVATLLGENIGLYVKSVIIQLLEQVGDDLITSLVPFLIQCVKYDSFNLLLVEYLLKLSLKSKKVGNQLFWILKSESDHPVCRWTLSKYLKMLDEKDREVIRNQCLFFDSIEKRLIFELNYEVLLPYTLKKIKMMHAFNYSVKDTIHNHVVLELETGDMVKLIFRTRAIDIYASFVINNFLNIIGREVDDNNSMIIEHYMIGKDKAFTIIPESLELIQFSNSSLESSLEVFSEICAKQKTRTQIENFTTSMTLELFIRSAFKTNPITEFYINSEGVVTSETYKLPQIRSKEIQVEDRKLDAFFAKNNKNFLDRGQELIDRLRNYLKRSELIVGFFNAYGYHRKDFRIYNVGKFLNEKSVAIETILLDIISPKPIRRFFDKRK